MAVNFSRTLLQLAKAQRNQTRCSTSSFSIHWNKRQHNLASVSSNWRWKLIGSISLISAVLSAVWKISVYDLDFAPPLKSGLLKSFLTVFLLLLVIDKMGLCLFLSTWILKCAFLIFFNTATPTSTMLKSGSIKTPTFRFKSFIRVIKEIAG